MTFTPRPLSKLAALAPFALAIALVGLVSSGCEDKHIGRVCSLDIPDAGASTTGQTATFNGQAVECPTRICILPAMQKGAVNTTSLCSAFCSSDDDCDGETNSSSTSQQCKSGFACVYPTTVGDFCCQKMCVCKDFIDTTRKDFAAKPAACIPTPGVPSTCKNVN